MEGPSLGALLVPVAWAIFLGAIALTVLLGAILAYHWFRYAMNPPAAVTALITYSIVSGFLLSGVLAATIAIHIAY
ncbi:MAG TPA: hypothetical protein VNM40_00670 [Candidatus Paceibacterota bacterium]|nr:hypothetical protein [Candidatus Paceibacterota bacterium]